MNFRRFLVVQSFIMTAGSIVFPFYLLVIKNIGESYSEFGWAYGLFTLTSALVYPLVGRLEDRWGDKRLLIIYTISMAFVMLIIPLITRVWGVYVIQIAMGMLGAVQKNTEKTVIARDVQKKTAGKAIGNYHLRISLWSAVGIIVTGYLVDFLTIATLFYITSLLYIIAFVILLRKET